MMLTTAKTTTMPTTMPLTTTSASPSSLLRATLTPDRGKADAPRPSIFKNEKVTPLDGGYFENGIVYELVTPVNF